MIFSTGASLSDQVHQTPPVMFSKPDERAKISCTHSIDSYNQILWYKQTNGELQFLGYMLAGSPTPEKGLDIKMEGRADKGQTCTLTTERLQRNDSAVYFCAASFHSATSLCSPVQKPPRRTAQSCAPVINHSNQRWCLALSISHIVIGL